MTQSMICGVNRLLSEHMPIEFPLMGRLVNGIVIYLMVPNVYIGFEAAISNCRNKLNFFAYK